MDSPGREESGEFGTGGQSMCRGPPESSQGQETLSFGQCVEEPPHTGAKWTLIKIYIYLLLA